MDPLTAADIEVIKGQVAGLPVAYNVEVVEDGEAEGWATVFPEDPADVKRVPSFSFGRAAGRVVWGVGKPGASFQGITAFLDMADAAEMMAWKVSVALRGIMGDGASNVTRGIAAH